MRITCNGRALEVAAATISELLAEMKITAARTAVERNRALVPQRLWPETRLAEGDAIEVVQMVGGG
ncbi:MAG: sulfur carrier protein ThiS [Terriglobales bacterium]